MTGEVRVAIRLLLEHHPLCSVFAADRLRIAGIALCSGCIAAGPTALAAFLAAIVLVLAGSSATGLFVAGAVLGLPQLTTYLHRGTRAWRFAVKFLGGVGIGLVVGSAWFLPVARWSLLLGGTGIAGVFAALQGLRVRAILRTCDSCSYKRDWDRCPGFNVPAPGHPPLAVPVLPANPVAKG